jgi:hypothetical protein
LIDASPPVTTISLIGGFPQKFFAIFAGFGVFALGRRPFVEARPRLPGRPGCGTLDVRVNAIGR